MSANPSAKLNSNNIVAYLGEIFERRGGEEYLGEPVTMAQHMLQSAFFAEQAGEPEIVVIAALLHDIGHFTSEFGMFSMEDTEDRFHEEAGAEILSDFFPDMVTDSVRHHVAAKRYLCATDADYFAKLSAASVHSLNLQGGPMSHMEIEEFEALENYDCVVRVRRYDDAGKIADLPTKTYQDYAPMVQAIVDRHAREG
ncbi:MAG: (R)-1-hydroxy-2-trimethylaminoethylphosphonate oxygenase [Rhizobiaceae bacterium]